mmetsp:Transcript_22461/g.62841  ORF Transcript_22461/g.62841 Transcript_22461/m.62841 type:complete len:244 (+) Transcript_22461:220-951(+)
MFILLQRPDCSGDGHGRFSRLRVPVWSQVGGDCLDVDGPGHNLWPDGRVRQASGAAATRPRHLWEGGQTSGEGLGPELPGECIQQNGESRRGLGGAEVLHGLGRGRCSATCRYRQGLRRVGRRGAVQTAPGKSDPPPAATAGSLAPTCGRRQRKPRCGIWPARADAEAPTVDRGRAADLTAGAGSRAPWRRSRTPAAGLGVRCRGRRGQAAGSAGAGIGDQGARVRQVEPATGRSARGPRRGL